MQIQVQIQTQIQVQYQIGIHSAAGPRWLEADCKDCTDQSPWQTTTLNTLCRAPLENYNCPTPKTTAPINSLYTVLFKYLHLSQFNSLRALFKQQ